MMVLQLPLYLCLFPAIFSRQILQKALLPLPHWATWEKKILMFHWMKTVDMPLLLLQICNPSSATLRPQVFCTFGPAAQHAGSLFPEQQSNLCPLHWKCGVLTIGLPGKSHGIFFYFLKKILDSKSPSISDEEVQYIYSCINKKEQLKPGAAHYCHLLTAA